MNRWFWLRGLFFMMAIWIAWAILDRPILMATRRPSSIGGEVTFPPAIRSCLERANSLYPHLSASSSVSLQGIFEDSKSFPRKMRVAWVPSEFQWKLQQWSTGDISEWQTIAKFWDVDGDSFPDEALLLVDSGKLSTWYRSEDATQWSIFTRLEKDGTSWAWLARLERKDWSPENDCYAWANPVVTFVNWAVMQHRWSPSMALADSIPSKSPASSIR
jgi:hypothetical protein